MQSKCNQIFEAVLEKGEGFSAVVKRPDRLDELVFENTDEISPQESDCEHGEESFYPLDVSKMSILDIEPAGF